MNSDPRFVVCLLCARLHRLIRSGKKYKSTQNKNKHKHKPILYGSELPVPTLRPSVLTVTPLCLSPSQIPFRGGETSYNFFHIQQYKLNTNIQMQVYTKNFTLSAL